jgi:hypothetical protein
MRECELFIKEKKSPEGHVLEWLEIFCSPPSVRSLPVLKGKMGSITYLFIYYIVFQGNLTIVGGPLNANVAVVALVMVT